MVHHDESRRLKALGLTAAFCAALGGTLTAVEEPAHAFDPVLTKTYLDLGYSALRLGREVLGLFGQDLGTQLGNLQSSIIGELRTQRNRALIQRTNTVFNLFRNLADNAPNDPTNVSMWTSIVTEQQLTADAMFDIIVNVNDPQSAYELTSSYNVLVATGADVLKIKREIASGFGSSWNDYYHWLQPGMEANYKLVGSQFHQCWPGFNPGYRPPPTSPLLLPNWFATVEPGKYRNSKLWTGKLANRGIHVETWNRVCSIGHGVVQAAPYEKKCNPGTKSCDDPGPACMTTGARTWGACEAGVSPLACAERLAKPGFDADAAVKTARVGMINIQKLSGGNDFEGASNNPLVSQNKYVDPWVSEGSCGSTAPWAYPQLP